MSFSILTNVERKELRVGRFVRQNVVDLVPRAEWDWSFKLTVAREATGEELTINLDNVKKRNQALADILGPAFNRRWYAANWHLYVCVASYISSAKHGGPAILRIEGPERATLSLRVGNYRQSWVVDQLKRAGNGRTSEACHAFAQQVARQFSAYRNLAEVA